MSGSLPKLGILAGGGMMPLRLAEAARSQGRDVHIIGLSGEALSEIEQFEHTWMKWGEIGLLFRTLQDNNCREVVIIGSVRRPDMRNVRFDLGGLKILPFILSLMSGGDDSVLSRIVQYFEKKGYVIRGAHEVAPLLVASSGVMTKKSPNSRDEKDIETGFRVVRTLGTLDIGQAAVVVKNYVLAVEAAEGTDAMLERCRHLQQWGNRKRRGVLVKCPKPGQEQRIDMPTIGSRTIELAAEAGLAGVAVAADGVLLADREDMIKTAQKHNMFIIGVTASDISQGISFDKKG